MKIAISTDSGEVSAHFGRCPEFTIVEVEEGNVLKKETIPNPGHHPGFLPEFLQKKGVSVIITGGMGNRAQMLFAEQKIQTIMGISGRIEEIIEKFAAGKLEGGDSLCKPGAGKGYGVEKTECDHPHEKEES
ncbi:MAG: dinitrogenase iron-molybdenum cofactor [Candidatus Saganbacteria bacterium]|nr:dinitrogenase iron-molybdenum cofactor [Candidatus Saganbacteria bacterium]